MASKGFVYILINPSMPGLLKIGKTTRSPEDRAKEISSATGVATPFIVAYKIELNDCDGCEQYIHKLLEAKGQRVNLSREFFEADMTDVINALINYKNEYDSLTADDEIYETNDEFEPWESEENNGDNWYYGTDGHIIDYNEAIKHYKYAIQLGSKTAFSKIGTIYLENENINDSFKFLTEGINKGCFDCYRVLSNYYFELYRISYDKILFDNTFKLDDNFEYYERCGYLDNAQRAFKSYVEKSREILGEVFLQTPTFAFFAAMYIDNLNLNSSHGGKINYDIFPLLSPYKNEIYNQLYDIIRRRTDSITEVGYQTSHSTIDEYFNEYYARFFDRM